MRSASHQSEEEKLKEKFEEFYKKEKGNLSQLNSGRSKWENQSIWITEGETGTSQERP